MIQKYKLYSLLLAAPLFLLGCSDEEGAIISNNNKEAICINAGIDTRQIGVKTRDFLPNKDGYYAFTQGTQISLRTEGKWAEKTNPNIIKVSTATTSEEQKTGSETSLVKYNNLSIASTANPLYWDDFGTADPANIENRTAGLTMYGAAVDGLTTGGPTISDTEYTISWDLGNVQSGTDGWSKKDLLISNNIKNGTTDNRYKFANKATAANLIFTHAMSQITVNLYQGDGFSDTEVTTGLNASVQILKFATSGTVNVTNGETSVTAPADNSAITPKTESADSLDKDKKFATYTALVFPGNTSSPAVNEFKKDVNVLKITVNKNTYYVTGAKIIEAAETGGTATTHTLKPGTNYVFNIKVSKTGLNITAQIAPWKTYVAAEETPVLNISADRTDGTTADALKTGFKLYYSDNATTNYTTSIMFGSETGTASPVTIGWDNTNNKYTYPKLYWPNHTTGYFFRGVVALNSKENAIAKDETNDFHPTVNAKTEGDFISLESGKEDKYNVLIGTHANNVTGNNGDGALATTGNVRLTFKHMMSHVTVLLRTTEGDDKVNLGTTADDMPKVEVLSFKKDGEALLGAGTVKATTATPADYTMPEISTTYNATATDNYYSRASYMVPQTLTDNMKFKVTIKNSDNTTDTYTSVAINKIKVQTGGETAQAATEWKEGCKYVYTLTIKKTGISVSAVVAPWTEYTGSTTVPFM